MNTSKSPNRFDFLLNIGLERDLLKHQGITLLELKKTKIYEHTLKLNLKALQFKVN